MGIIAMIAYWNMSVRNAESVAFIMRTMDLTVTKSIVTPVLMTKGKRVSFAGNLLVKWFH